MSDDLVTRLRRDAQGEDLGADGMGWSPDPDLKREAAAEIERLRAALRTLRDAVIEQNRAGASWHPQVFASMMSGLEQAAAVLSSLPEPPKEAGAVFTTPFQRGELAGNGKPCPNNHDPDCRWPQCVCMERAAAEMAEQEQTR